LRTIPKAQDKKFLKTRDIEWFEDIDTGIMRDLELSTHARNIGHLQIQYRDVRMSLFLYEILIPNSSATAAGKAESRKSVENG